MINRYFPQGIAVDDAFCNRVKERNTIKTNIEAHEHIVLVAPRRYGKTSLVTQVLKDNEFAGTHIDFFFVLKQAEVRKNIAEGVSQIISALLPKTKAASTKILDSVRTLNPKLTFSMLGQQLEISTKQTSEKSISELLFALDQIAKKTKKACVIVFDEFQQIGELTENHAIEAAIRHAVERSEYVSYVFCGSNRHLLSEMFSNKTRPLYHLCDLMILERIDSQHYFDFLHHLSKMKWKKAIDNDVINEVIHLTENHPYYFNALCRQLWRFDKLPNLSVVQTTWDQYVDRQSHWIIDDISKLTLNRRKVLTALAFNSTTIPQGQEFSKRVGMTPSIIKRSLSDLVKLDMVFCDQNKTYRVLDPALAYCIRKNT